MSSYHIINGKWPLKMELFVISIYKMLMWFSTQKNIHYFLIENHAKLVKNWMKNNFLQSFILFFLCWHMQTTFWKTFYCGRYFWVSVSECSSFILFFSLPPHQHFEHLLGQAGQGFHQVCRSCPKETGVVEHCDQNIEKLKRFFLAKTHNIR